MAARPRRVEPEIRRRFTASAFAGAPVIAPGTWIEIFGRNLSATTRAWKEADFTGPAPTSLDDVSVSIGGVRAFVSYVSPGQVNALVPAGVPAGMAKVMVTNRSGESSPYPVEVVELQPGFLCFQADPSPYGSWVAALFPDFAIFAAPPWYPPSRRARPGDTIILLAIGLGPVEPAVPVGRIAPGASRMTSPVAVYFSRRDVVKATVTYAGLVPGTVGLYQINVIVPDILYPDLPIDDYVGVSVNVGGKPTLLDARRGLFIGMAK